MNNNSRLVAICLAAGLSLFLKGCGTEKYVPSRYAPDDMCDLRINDLEIMEVGEEKTYQPEDPPTAFQRLFYTTQYYIRRLGGR